MEDTSAKQERCMTALNHARDLFEQALGSWFGSSNGSNLNVAGYEDLKLFVDSTSRSFSLKLKKRGFERDIPGREISEGLLELLRKKLVEEEEAMVAADWERVMHFLNKAVASEVEEAKKDLLKKRNDLERRLARASSLAVMTGGHSAEAGTVIRECERLKEAVNEQNEILCSRVQSRKDRVLAHIHRNLEFAESALQQTVTALSRAESLIAISEEGVKEGTGLEGGACDEGVLLQARIVVEELDELAGGPGAETLMMPSGFDPMKVLGLAKHLDLSEQIHVCASMDLAGLPSSIRTPGPPFQTPSKPHALVFEKDDAMNMHSTPHADLHTETACSRTKVQHEETHTEPPCTQEGSQGQQHSDESTAWVADFKEPFLAAPSNDTTDTSAALPHLPPPPASRRLFSQQQPAGGGADLIDLSDPAPGGEPSVCDQDREEQACKASPGGGHVHDVDDLERAVEMLGVT